MTRPMKLACRGQSLVGLLVVLVIIALGAGIFIWGPWRGSDDAPAVSTPRAAIGQAQGVQCASQLQQIRQALQMAQATEGACPESLTLLGGYGVTGSMLQCPENGQPYQYDPDAGQVWCPDHSSP